MIEIREMKPEEAPLLYEMSGLAGWNHSREECAAMAGNGWAQGYFLFCEGTLAGTAGAVTYGKNEMLFINMVIVKPEFRRRGFATRMIEFLKQRYSGCRVFRLDASPDGSKVYEKIGFKTRRMISCFEADSLQCGKLDLRGISPMTADFPARAAEADSRNYGVFRGPLFDWNFRHNAGLALVSPEGFVLGRHGRKRRMISALEAVSPEGAFRLAAAAASLGPGPVGIITYDSQKEFQALLLKAGFRKTREMFDMEFKNAGTTPAAHYRALYGGDFG